MADTLKNKGHVGFFGVSVMDDTKSIPLNPLSFQLSLFFAMFAAFCCCG